MSTTDYTRLLNKLIPPADGEDPVRLRKGVVTAVNGDGTADITLSGVTVEDVPVLAGATIAVANTVQILSTKGSLLILGVGSATPAAVNPNIFVTFGTPSIPNNSITALTPTSAPVNDGPMWSSGTTFTVPAGQGGLYEIGVVLRYATQASTLGHRQARLTTNGVDYMLFQNPAGSTMDANNTIVSGVTRVVLAAAATIGFQAYQNSTVSLALTGNSIGWIERVH